MNRIDRLYTYLNKYVFLDDRRELRHIYLMHMQGVAQFAAMIALRRGVNPEIATIAGLLHDIHTLDTLDTIKHAQKGAKEAREILTQIGGYSIEEKDAICDAIKHHSDKKTVHAQLDEVLKDADVMQHCMYNVHMLPSDKDAPRFSRLLNEFGMQNPHG